MSTSAETPNSITIPSSNTRKALHKPTHPGHRFDLYNVRKELLDSIRVEIGSVLVVFEQLDLADSGADAMSWNWQFRVAGINNNGATSVEEYIDSTNEILRKLQSDNPEDWPKCTFKVTYTNANWDEPIIETEEIPVHLCPDGGIFEKPRKDFNLAEEGNTATLHSFTCTKI